ncbi:ABC transporter [Penicillium malachiteum]|uniref:ABC transporter n=1 Tax=Penicillium malachiteum TaxID=1324776 RepID=UPI0025490681|nr:ABC transporter [Penicillium malachiteum]KAJ5725300.1 ABC transporter [Penicillium malachiteum]
MFKRTRPPDGFLFKNFLHIAPARSQIELSFKGGTLNQQQDLYMSMMKRLKDLVAYVPQDDTLIANLTVRENILFSARIRIGNSCPAKDLEMFVDSLISALGLDKVRHQLVGDTAKRGLSGGERKHVNIGLELVAAPQILALDEPTSGLDAKMALDIMQLLKELATNGILIICVIHQPRSEIFALLDDLLLLHAGQQMYFGAAAEASQYVDLSDKKSSPAQNSADSIMDALVSGRYRNDPSFTLERRVNTSLSQDVTKTPHQTITTATVHSLLSSIQQLRAPWYRQLALVFIRGIIQQGRETSSLSLEMLSELTFYRESHAGHSESAYFFGKVLSTIPRIFLSALHYTTFFMVLTTPVISFGLQLTLERLPYLSAVIKEGVRITGVVASRLPRISPEDTLFFDNWVITPGTPVSMSNHFILRDPNIFPDPLMFVPERWMESSQSLEKYLVPFSKGSQGCLGFNMAYLWMNLGIARLLRCFDLELFDTTEENVRIIRILGQIS